jgi:hypothetical protein
VKSGMGVVWGGRGMEEAGVHRPRRWRRRRHRKRRQVTDETRVVGSELQSCPMGRLVDAVVRLLLGQDQVSLVAGPLVIGLSSENGIVRFPRLCSRNLEI